MHRHFQPYEAHIPYILQFMADYNLYGCGYVNCARVYFRDPVPTEEEIGDIHSWHKDSIDPANILNEAEFPRVSHCSLEVDIQVHDILNRLQVKPRYIHQDFLERLSPLSPDQKLVPSMAELWRDEQRRRKLKDLST